MPKKDKPKKKYTVSGERTSKEGQTTKVYRKDGSIKSEKNIKSSGTKKESRYSASPRTLSRSKKEVEVKDPARASYTKYKKDGTVKKAISAKDAATTNRKGETIGVDAKVQKKMRKKSVRDRKGAVKVAEKDVKIKRSPAKMSGKAYDNKEAYNKNLSASARLHYLENERADDKSPMKMYKKSPMNMYGNKSPLEKELVGKQNNLPPELKAKIEASPAKMYGKKESPMNMSRDLSYGGPVIDQEPKALSHMGASKVLRHMKGSSHSPLNMNGPGKPKEKAMKSDTVRGFDSYKVGDMVSEDDFEAKFKKEGNNPKNYPQLSVQDYSNVKKDKKGKYVVKLND